MAAPSMQSLFQNVNTELDKIQAWFESNRLSINVSKICFQFQHMLPKRSIKDAPQIAINNPSIRRANSVKCLRVIVDESLPSKNILSMLPKKLNWNWISLSGKTSPELTGGHLKFGQN